MKKSIVFAMFIALVFASYVNGGTILDQSQTNYSFALRIFSQRSLCQTFTAGVSGNLVRVDIRHDENPSYPLNGSLPATIRILGTTGGVPNDVVFYTNTFANLTQGWFTLSIPEPTPFLHEGDVYGIEIQCADSIIGTPDDVWDAQTTGNLYQSGKLWEKRSGGWVALTINGIPFPDADAAFKTYVKPSTGTVVKIF